jgi:endoglucanase
MGPELSWRVRRLLPAVAGIACALLLFVLGQAPGRAAGVPLSISIQGNHFVNGAGQTVRLLGANHPSFEYACQQGYAYNDGNMNAADAAAVASWHATAVRVPLNEDCWLGINGQPSNSQNPNPALTMAGYRQAVEQYVTDLNNAGLYVILDLHWTAPGSVIADGQRPMPDDHSGAFWTSVATTFKDNHAVVFDAFNEPFSPAANGGTSYAVDWDCWRNGALNKDCFLPTSKDGNPPDNNSLYSPVGMQYLVDQIRATSATQPILLGGLAYANDLTGWLQYEPHDPLGQLAASFHNYQGQACGNQACWDAQIAPVAAQVPVVTGEFDQDVCKPSTFDVDYMNWADQHGVGYLAWGWWVLSSQEIADAGCSAYYLITDPSGTPAAPNGVNLHDHLAALPAGSQPTTTTPSPGGSPSSSTPPRLRGFSARVKPDGGAVSFVVRADQASSGVISGTTVNSFITAAKSHRRRVSLGSVRFGLAAGKSKTVVLKLSKPSRRLLTRRRALKVQITITLTNAAQRRGVSHRTLTLKAPPRHGNGH